MVLVVVGVVGGGIDIAAVIGVATDVDVDYDGAAVLVVVAAVVVAVGVVAVGVVAGVIVAVVV